MSFWARVKLITSSIWKVIEPTIKWIGSKVGATIMDLALQAVTEVAMDPSLIKSGGLARRQAAFDKIVAEAKKKGLQLGADFLAREVNKAIEIQYDNQVLAGNIKEEE